MLSLLSIPVTFKEVYTTNTRNFHVNPNWSVTQFMDSVLPHLSTEFNLSLDVIEIVEAGQKLKESAPALVKTPTMLKEKWGEKLFVSFYIRKKNFVYPITVNQTVDECPVCLEIVRVFTRHECSHKICDNCHNRCQQVRYTVCPLCRHV